MHKCARRYGMAWANAWAVKLKLKNGRGTRNSRTENAKGIIKNKNAKGKGGSLASALRITENN